MIKSKKAFTLVELILAITISAIVLLFLMNYLASIFDEISYTNKKTKLIISLYEVEYKIRTLRQKYLLSDILKDNLEWDWSDILILKTDPGEPEQWWYIFALIDKDTLKVDPNGNIDNISEKVLAHRKISSSELWELNTSPDKIYEYSFNRDEIFEDMILKDFQLNIYNWWKIIEVIIYSNIDYEKETNWEKYSVLWNLKIEKIVFNF